MFILWRLSKFLRLLFFKSLINTFMANNSKNICPSYRGKEGNPLIIPKLYYKKIIDLKNDAPKIIFQK